MSYFHITGNFATEGQCGTCKHMILCGCVIGVCKANNYERQNLQFTVGYIADTEKEAIAKLVRDLQANSLHGVLKRV